MGPCLSSPSNEADDDGATPLGEATKNDDEAVVKMLIRAGADVNKADKYGRTPLKWATKNGNEAVVKMLIRAGADVNKAPCGIYAWDEPPLGDAVRNGHEAVVKMLIAAGADVNKASPLGRAATHCLVAVVKMLIAAGADANTADIDGDTPLGEAVKFCDDDRSYLDTVFVKKVLMDSEAVVKMLIAAGADPNLSLIHI